ncbi:MAG TPA: GNAT family N-acetyltransferase [Opitutaceae bacterium]|nr:GNAT family N-acetyltransferase [Opitutaceae bacterium]
MSVPRPPEVFATARLSARKPRVDDAPAVFESYANDPEVTRYLSWRAYERVEPLKVFLAEIISHWEKGESHLAWLLCLKGSDRPIGSIGVTFDGGKAMFGYVFAKKFWGRGFATEALTFLVDWSLAQPGISRAWAYCDVEHPASVRVMEKSGMVREGLLHRWHVCPTLGPELRDCVVCAKVK